MSTKVGLQKNVWVLFLFLSLKVFSQKQMSIPETRSFVKATMEKLKKYTDIKYDADLKFKFFDKKDTLVYAKQKCEIQKAPSDSFFKYYSIISDSITKRVYTADAFYFINTQLKTAYWTGGNSMNYSFVRNNIGRDFVPSLIYSDSAFEKLMSSADKITQRGDENINSTICSVVQFEFAPTEEITKSLFTIYIDKKTFLPTRIIQFSVYKNIQTEYKELNITNLVGETKQGSTLRYFLPDEYKTVVVPTPQKIKTTLLSEGKEAPDFMLKDINKNVFHLSKLKKQKLILLDFWYLACPPCLRAAPELSKLKNTYEKKGLQILGVNSIDNNEYKIKEIKRFLPALKMNYPLLVANTKTIENYKITNWPTIYLIENGKVIYSHEGYDETSFKKLVSLIKEKLD